MLMEVECLDDPEVGVRATREDLAYVKEVRGDTHPFKVKSRRTEIQLAAFTQRVHAEAFINNVAYDVLLR
jgi:hypothetical protein